MKRSEAVLDACTLLNLLATGQEVDIATALGLHVFTTTQAAAQVTFLQSLPDETGYRSRVPADMGPMLRSGLLQVVNIGEDEADELIRCAEFLDDVDASCVALAAVRGWTLVTDDGKERKVASRLYPGISLRTTLSYIREFVSVSSLSVSNATRLAHALRWRGNFMPPRSDPDGPWFADILARAP